MCLLPCHVVGARCRRSHARGGAAPAPDAAVGQRCCAAACMLVCPLVAVVALCMHACMALRRPPALLWTLHAAWHARVRSKARPRCGWTHCLARAGHHSSALLASTLPRRRVAALRAGRLANEGGRAGVDGRKPLPATHARGFARPLHAACNDCALRATHITTAELRSFQFVWHPANENIIVARRPLSRAPSAVCPPWASTGHTARECQRRMRREG